MLKNPQGDAEQMGDSFEGLGIRGSLVERVGVLGFSEPTAVQRAVIPLVLKGGSVLFEAETGSGKTHAYALPLIQLYGAEKTSAVCVAAPTHELASQLKKMFEAASGLRIPLIIGGAPVKRQIETIRANKSPVIVGTPQRLSELCALKKIRASEIRALVLDEADRLFSKELIQASRALFEQAQEPLQIIASSATISPKAQNTFTEFAKEYRFVKIEKNEVLKNYIEHQALFAEDRDKIDVLKKYLRAVMDEAGFKALVFCARLDAAQKVFMALNAKMRCGAIHARATKQERKSAMDSFRSGKTRVLVTSDVSARGLDIPDITHIIQMDLPEAESFIHRAGRTARAGRNGINIVIGSAWEMRQYARLEKQLGIAVHPKALYGGKLITPQAVEEQDAPSQKF
jgi:superfamily II DNA/RNA helicase